MPRIAARWTNVFSLLVYKKGLYLVGHSHEHGEVRTFGLDGFSDITWRRNDRFEYPRDYQPEKLVEGAFGLIAGPPERVRIFFADEVARYVRRQQWHPTQKIKKAEGGIELSMDVAVTREVVTWLLGYGARARVIEPAELRRRVREEHALAATMG